MHSRKILILVSFIFVALNANAQQEGFVKSVDGTSIYFRTYGTGQPLLIINGGPGMNSNGFENLAKKLSDRYRTIIYDQRGTGKSILAKVDSTTITMDLMLADIESLRNYFKFEKWSILGHSFGGMLVSYYATKYPQHIERMVLSSSGGIDLGLLNYVNNSIAAKLTLVEKDSLQYWNSRISDGDTTFASKLGRGRALAPAYLHNKVYIPILANRLTQGNSEINKLIWSDLERIKFDCAEDLSTYDKPVLIIQGKEDIINAETAEVAHKALKNSKVVFIENSGHYGWLDNESVYFYEVNSFLTPGKAGKISSVNERQ